jgi:GntR family transcriptional regulator/MocR family aminotransferase
MSQRLDAALWKQLLQHGAQQHQGLQAQVRAMVVEAILDGLLPPHTPLPSSRELAQALGVARNTVVLAYQQLADEGYVQPRQRSGYFVSPDITAGRVRAASASAQASPAPLPSRRPDWPARFKQRPSALRSIVKPADWQRYPYPFLYGQFDAALFPTADWRECVIKTLSVVDIRDWGPDQIMRDDPRLVQQICSRVLPRRGVWASPEEVVVTVGAQHALYLLADLLMRHGTHVAMEDPGYPDARNIFASRTGVLRPVAVDEAGLPVGAALTGCDYIYATPSHQCPTTVTMPLQRRQALLRMAQEQDFVIIEDDYESENRFDGDPFPALKSLDRDDRVIYIGSLSKSVAPGLRMGYVVGPSELVAELRALRRLELRHPSALVQRAFALFLSLGHHDALLRRQAAAWRDRAAAVVSALARQAPQCQVVPVSGGSSCWVQLPDSMDGSELAARARERGVLIEPGEVFFMTEPAPRHFVRIGWSAIPLPAIEPGIALLGEVMRQM